MTDSEYAKIGTRIATVRRSNKMTQERLAEILEVTSKHVSHVENSTSSFSLKQMIRFCELFNCSFDYLIFGDEKNNLLAELPQEIVRILQQNDPDELDRLKRYLNIFIEMKNEY